MYEVVSTIAAIEAPLAIIPRLRREQVINFSLLSNLESLRSNRGRKLVVKSAATEIAY